MLRRLVVSAILGLPLTSSVHRRRGTPSLVKVFTSCFHGIPGEPRATCDLRRAGTDTVAVAAREQATQPKSDRMNGYANP